MGYVESAASNRSLTRVRTFCKAISPVVEAALRERMITTPHLAGLSDPNSSDGARLAIFSVEEELLRRSNIRRTGGDIGIPHLHDVAPGAYFTTPEDEKIVLDFTAGQYASLYQTTLDEWMRLYPHLFTGRALVGYKEIIEHTLGLVYPAQNVNFWTYFHTPTHTLFSQQPPLVAAR